VTPDSPPPSPAPTPPHAAPGDETAAQPDRAVAPPAAPRLPAEMTPMMRQYRELKQRYPDYLLLFRLGDFYELFFEGAHVGSRLLQITLTARQNIPMAGIPYHAADTYIARLVRAGQKVAVSGGVLLQLTPRSEPNPARPGQRFVLHSLARAKSGPENRRSCAQPPWASGMAWRFILRYRVLRLMPSCAATRVMFP